MVLFLFKINIQRKKVSSFSSFDSETFVWSIERSEYTTGFCVNILFFSSTSGYTWMAKSRTSKIHNVLNLWLTPRRPPETVLFSSSIVIVMPHCVTNQATVGTGDTRRPVAFSTTVQSIASTHSDVTAAARTRRVQPYSDNTVLETSSNTIIVSVNCVICNELDFEQFKSLVRYKTDVPRILLWNWFRISQLESWNCDIVARV